MRDKEKQREYNRNYYQANKKEAAEKQRAYRATRKAETAAYQKKYREEHKEERREYARNYAFAMRQIDIGFRVKNNMRSRLYTAIKDQNTTRDSTTMNLTGCSVDALISHLESQFAEGMTWDNYGEWHVDHIRPCASFDLSLDREQKKCFHYMNLQPLWAEDNRRKSAKHK